MTHYRVLLVHHQIINQTICRPWEQEFAKKYAESISITFVSSISEAVSRMEDSQRFHLVLADLCLDPDQPELYSGIEWLNKLMNTRVEYRPIRAAIFSSRDSLNAFEETYRNKLAGYLSADMAISDLASAVYRILSNGRWVSSRLRDTLLNQKRNRSTLTNADKRLIEEYLQNKTKPEIAQSLRWNTHRLNTRQRKLLEKTKNKTLIAALIKLDSGSNFAGKT